MSDLEPAPFDFEAWLAKIDAIHAEILAERGENYRVDGQSLLDELRDIDLTPYPLSVNGEGKVPPRVNAGVRWVYPSQEVTEPENKA